MKVGCPLEKGGLDEMFMDVTEMVVREPRFPETAVT